MASILNGLFAGRAGIQSHGAAISVLADNISNANTVAYKASRAEFVDLLAGNISGQGAGANVGSGSAVTNVTQVFGQGTFEFTGRGLDVAIDGNGFFVVRDNTGAQYYSRAGNFRVDGDGNLLNQNGLKVMGFRNTGSGSLEAINVNDISTSTAPTRNATLSGNLDARVAEVAGFPPAAGSSYQVLNGLASFSTFVDVYDSLGEAHAVTLFFAKTDAATNTWTIAAYTDGGQVATNAAGNPVAAGVPALIGQSTIVFDSDGAQVGGPATLNIGGVGNGTTWLNGSSAPEIEMAFQPFTQFATSSYIGSISQDGTGSGSVVSFTVEPDGSLFALLDNGQTAVVARLALASFANPEGLRRAGNSRYIQSADSGEPVIGTPATGRFGLIASGALELSTADIASDFITLISLQRGFQGSARIIRNIDELLNEIVNLA